MRPWFPVVLVLAPALSADPAPRALEILSANCAQCHSKTLALSGLDLSSRDAALKGGSRGAALTPGNAAASRLIQVVERKDPKLAMPPTKALAAADVETLKEWVNAGAQWTGSLQQRPTWWSLQKPVRPAVPRSGNAWAQNEIDEFVWAKLQANQLQPSPEADRRTLLRRVTFDLTGLPPTSAELDAFVRDKSADAWSKVVERLLASNHYGEKWGRHWLDLARYSDTAGFELDSYIHDAWRYRDYVIQSFNQDKPYDRFIKEQIAGDELFLEDPVSQTGTGLFCVGPNRDLFPDQADINREEILTDYADTTAGVFLGLTAGCARCHDHKFDPISQKDYYQIRAIFAPAVKTAIPLNRLGSLGHLVGESVREWKLREIGENIRAARGRCQKQLSAEKTKPLPAEVQAALQLADDERTPRQRELASEYGGKVGVTDDEIRACLSASERDALASSERKLVRMFAEYRPKPFACGLNDVGDHAPRTFIPAKSGRPKQEVQPGFFSALQWEGGNFEVPPPPEDRVATGPIPLAPTTGRRTALAQWIATPDNPLTARVMANRIWQFHFGRGLVATPSDFGTRGRAPTHPELLDWLATEFVGRGWSIKQMHRLILHSATYRQSSLATATAMEKDPENLLLARFSRRRLNADEIRDAALAATGTLNKEMYGRPVVTPLSKEELENLTQRPDDAWVVTADTRHHTRRSVYLLQKRTFRLPMMEVFDAPESMLTCPKRESSTTAPQSLTLLNSSFSIEQSRGLALQVAQQYATNEAAVAALWQQLLLRAPEATEVTRAVAFLRQQQTNASTREAALAELIRGMLNLNEFLYVD
jgi:hypothetical protein